MPDSMPSWEKEYGSVKSTWATYKMENFSVKHELKGTKRVTLSDSFSRCFWWWIFGSNEWGDLLDLRHSWTMHPKQNHHAKGYSWDWTWSGLALSLLPLCFPLHVLSRWGLWLLLPLLASETTLSPLSTKAVSRSEIHKRTLNETKIMI